MLVMPSGISIFSRPVQCANRYFGIAVSDFANVTLLSFWQSLKGPLALFSVEGIYISEIGVSLKAYSPSSSKPSFSVTLAREVQLSKA